MNDDPLVEIGLQILRDTHAPPMEVASQLISIHWGSLDSSVQRSWATLGLASLISGAVERLRQQSVRDLKERSSLKNFSTGTTAKARHDELALCRWPHSDSGIQRCNKSAEESIEYGLKQGKSPTRILAELRDERDGSYAEASRSDAEITRHFLTRAAEIVDEYAESLAVAKLREILLRDADGQMRSLFDFRQEDAAYWRSSAAVRAEAWTKREMWFAHAAAKLETFGCAQVHELPADDLEALASEAYAVWVKESA